MYYFSMMLVILSSVFYHISQKSISQTMHPAISLIITYGIALVLSGSMIIFFPLEESFLESFKAANWASYILGLSIVGLEVGYLLAYRAGWNISFAGIFNNAILAILLIPVGILVYKENISPINIVGIILSIIGIILINKK